MTDTTTSLIEKLEGAEVGSRELDAYVWASVNGYELFEHDGAGWRYRMRPDDIMRHERTSYISPVTTSLDAALALAERVLDQRGPININICLAGSAQVVIDSVGPCGPVMAQVVARTPALALCAAILRAQSEARV